MVFTKTFVNRVDLGGSMGGAYSVLEFLMTNGGADTSTTLDNDDFSNTDADGFRFFSLMGAPVNITTQGEDVRAVKAYNSTPDSDRITFTCNSGDSFIVQLLAKDNGG